MKRIAIFASGSGTNAQNICEYFSSRKGVIVDSIFSSRKDAYVLKRAEKLGVPAFVINREDFYSTDSYINLLKGRRIDLLVLAGFLWLVPPNLVRQFRIINIHPALLPKYGGKGMYGMKVHNAVIENGDKESGITIHHVNEVYDDGRLIFQARCAVDSSDTPEQVAEKVHQLEYKYYPEVIESLLFGKK